MVTDAMGLVLYGMFIAIIVPPAIKSKGVLLAVALSAGISCAFYFIPFLSGVSQGLSYVISALISACVTALIFPVKEKEDNV